MLEDTVHPSLCVCFSETSNSPYKNGVRFLCMDFVFWTDTLILSFSNVIFSVVRSTNEIPATLMELLWQQSNRHGHV